MGLGKEIWNQIKSGNLNIFDAFKAFGKGLVPDFIEDMFKKEKVNSEIENEKKDSLPKTMTTGTPGGGGNFGASGGANIGGFGGAHKSSGIASPTGRKGVISYPGSSIDDLNLNTKQVAKGGRIKAMQAGGLPTPPNPYGAAVGDDYNFGFSGGGEMPTEYLAGGKLLDGPGDGMSDDIPAVIRGKGVQRAALADGEFVVPADVVSHLGNGSTKAGAKKLYVMMDRIRKARTGTTEQAPAVKSDRFLPA